MIKISTKLLVADNSGAILTECLNVRKSNKRFGAVPGCLITISVKKNIFKKNIKKKSRIIVKGQIVQALVLITRKSKRRLGGFTIKAAGNHVILLNQYLLPLGTRLFGPIFREVRQKTNYRKVVTLSKNLL